MSGHVKAVIVILVLGLGAIFAAKHLLPVLQDTEQRETSDAVATRGTLRIGVDNWIGYFPLCSPTMVKHMRHAGYVLICEQDGGDYRERFSKLQNGTLDFAAATVDSYLAIGSGFGFPGTIVTVLDESKGGDAILARLDRAARLEDLKGAADLRIAYTPDSPSEHLMRAVGADFDIPSFRGRRGGKRIETNGSSEARERLLSGAADVAVLWEPDVSIALADPGVAKLIGSEDTEGLIVDVLLVARDYSQKHPEAVRALVEGFFQVMRRYREQAQLLRDEVIAATGLDGGQVRAMLQGVSWSTLTENALLWFGVSRVGPQQEERLVEAIQSSVRILVESGALRADPLPDRDPYRITNRQFVAELDETVAAKRADITPDEHRFPPLDDRAWSRLKEIGTLRTEPIGFQSGTADLNFDGKLEIDRVAERIKNYPNFRIAVKGHTGLRGDEQANLQLSQERADAVARYLIVTYDVDPNRLHSLGYGSSRPLPRKPGESDRSYGYRLPRVEIALMSESL